jgi:pimeloyl-ACP methyl ester carboxylesterase
MNALFLLMLGFSIQAGIKNGVSKEPPCPNSVDNGYAIYADHVVEIDSDGKLKSGTSVQHLFNKIARQPRKRIILYVHGGRVTLERARETTRCLTAAIQDSDPDAYPIFLNWEAGQATSYFRHVAYERNGVSYRESSNAPIVAIASPMVFMSDIGRGAFRLPINTLLSVGKLLQNWDAFVGRHDHFFPVKGKFDEQLLVFQGSTTDREKQLSKIYHDGFTYRATSHDLIPVSVSMGHDSHQGRVGFAMTYVATLPLQFGTEPILDTFGTPAWSNMVRRTRSMFHPQSRYILASHRPESELEGGAAKFFAALDRFMRHSSGNGFTLDIYAHSMGTMVTNQAFAEHPDLPVDHLVYMAAACSIRDFQQSAGRYIEKHNTPFYNLSLHPRAELDEVEVSGIPVRGSLLVWVDEFFSQPQSFADRTLGTFENAVLAQDLLPHGFNVHLKAFPVEDGAKKYKHLFAGPQKHNDFAEYYFWKSDFYNPDDAKHYYPRVVDR